MKAHGQRLARVTVVGTERLRRCDVEPARHEHRKGFNELMSSAEGMHMQLLHGDMTIADQRRRLDQRLLELGRQRYISNPPQHDQNAFVACMPMARANLLPDFSPYGAAY
jgi:hypothetical protein